ncbi:MAG: cation:proton antiporter [Bacteroidetes bacterium]|nr:MAG: cation:proton antiporter [Bacteroidota bacterium]
MDLFFIIIISVISLGAIFAVIRFIKGPTASDRVMALDTLSVMLIAVMVVLGFIMKRYIYIDVSLVYAVLGFIGVITIARYLEGGI